MSSRQLRNTLKTDLLAGVAGVEEDEGSRFVVPKRKVATGFAFSSSSDDDEDSDSSMEEAGSDDGKSVGVQAGCPVDKPRNSEKREGKNVPTKQTPSEEDIDKILDEAVHRRKVEMARMALNRGAGSGGDGGGGALYASLSVERKKLSAQAEFRKRFGSGTGHGSGADSYESSVRGRGKHKLRAAVSEVFVDVDPRWPPPPSRNAGGIGMVIADGTSQKFDSSCTYFSFVFSDKYELDQVQYENLAALHDPNSIAQFSHAHPFHVQSLLQMSTIHAMTQNYDNSALLLRQAIFVLESRRHPKFLECAQKGTARMDLDRKENKLFAQAMFAHALTSGRRGSRRAAYEILKLLLALDPHRDPMAALLCLDYYAIAAKEYQSFVDIISIPRHLGLAPHGTRDRGEQHPLTVLPNIAFSEALALYYLSRDRKMPWSKASQGDESENTLYTKSRAKHSLTTALLRFPIVFPALLFATESKFVKNSELNDLYNRTIDSNLWKEEKGHPLMDKLVQIFVKRNVELWKPEEVQDWVMECAEQAVENYKNSSALLLNQRRLRAASYRIGENTMGCKDGVYRYFSVDPSIFNDDAVHLPAEEVLQGGGQGGMHAGEANLDLNVNPAILFLQTLMPWNNAVGEYSPNANQ
jgi:hypothetical protein|eukprot:g7235.t1